MSLIDVYSKSVVRMTKASLPDGEGGTTTVWAPLGEAFDVAITFDSSIEAKAAEAKGVKSLYTITFPKDISFKYHDVIKVVSSGKILRITSDGDDNATPSTASFQVAQVSAEEWELS